MPSTGLFDSLSLYGSEASVMAAIVVVVDLELVLLTLFVLYGLVVRSEETRLKEVALTKLHGFPRAAVLSAGLAEPLVLVFFALPIGFLAAWGAVAVAAPTLLHSVDLLFTPPVFLSALTAYAGAVVATMVGSRRILNRRLMEEVQGINLKPSATGRAVLDGAALALAIGGMVELVHSGVLTRGQPNPLSLLAPVCSRWRWPWLGSGRFPGCAASGWDGLVPSQCPPVWPCARCCVVPHSPGRCW